MSLKDQSRLGLNAMVGAMLFASCLGGAQTASAASTRHHRRAVGSDFNAYVDPGFASGPAIGTWRFRTFRGGGCDRAYPMHEGYPCGSPTGGPVGGMGS